ncbi:MAG: PHP domain-containing protein [Clostridia bacterium]|nr:PHP domain-containing protein [Clostridia bacterium]
MTIIPTEKAFLLFEGEEYKLSVISINSDEPSYYSPTTHKTLTVRAEGGVLRFTYIFPDEQEHLIIVEYNGKKLQELTVYSLYEDLYGLTPLRGDLHSHSYRSDGKRDPAALAGHYREQGYDFFALTDHNRYYPGGEIDETYSGVDLALTRVKGEEVHTPGSVVHIVHVGGKASVTEQYINDREGYEAAVSEYMTRVPDAVPEQYRERYAMAMWATDRIHEAGGLAIFPHPYWRPGRAYTYNVCDEFARILLKSGMFDAYELVGGMTQPDINRSIALWGDLRAEGLRISVVGSSDVHGLEASPYFPHLFTICFAEDNDNDSVVRAIKSGRSVAVEATGAEYDRQYRCYGSLRLVSYAQFLLKNYFPVALRLCQGEGVAMRNYSMGLADKQVIELQAEQYRAFRDRFFGRTAPALPSFDMLNFEAKWRKVQLDGPLTKGSKLDSSTVSRQI